MHQKHHLEFIKMNKVEYWDVTFKRVVMHLKNQMSRCLCSNRETDRRTDGGGHNKIPLCVLLLSGLISGLPRWRRHSLCCCVKKINNNLDLLETRLYFLIGCFIHRQMGEINRGRGLHRSFPVKYISHSQWLACCVAF